jgi:hypothetical protein
MSGKVDPQFLDWDNLCSCRNCRLRYGEDGSGCEYAHYKESHLPHCSSYIPDRVKSNNPERMVEFVQ